MTATAPLAPEAPEVAPGETSAGAGPLGFLALILANAALALGPLFVRLADVGPVAAAFWRMALALPVLVLLAARWGGRGLSLSRGTLLLAAGAGLFFALDLASWHAGIVRTRMANATLFGNSASLLLVIWSIVVTRSMPRKPELAAILIAAAGAALLMGRSYELSPKHLAGDLLSLTAGVLYTGYILGMQRLRTTLSSWPALVLSTAATLAPLLLIALLGGERIVPHDWTPVLLLALSSQLIGQGLFIYALPQFSPLVIGLALLTQPAVASLVGWFVFNEHLVGLDWLGAAMVAAALVLVRWPERGRLGARRR